MGEALFPDEALVAIEVLDSGNEENITVHIDSFEESGFEREVEYRNFFGGAKVAIQKPQGEGEISMNAKITQATFDQLFWGGTGTTFTSGGAQSNARIVFLLTKEPGVTTATGALAAVYVHYRKTYANCFMTGWNPKLEAEGMLEGEMTFTVSATDEASDPNINIEVGPEAGGFPLVPAYTTGVKW